MDLLPDVVLSAVSDSSDGSADENCPAPLPPRLLLQTVSFFGRRTTRNWRGGSAMTSSELTLRSAGGGCVLGLWLLP